MLSISYQAYCAPQTYGYTLAMPNRFWPDTTNTRSLGNALQQNNAENNPDIFCESQGSGYRLPSLTEFTSQGNAISPWSPNNATFPAHWSSYENNDITKARLPNDGIARKVNGSLTNEWGDLTAYSTTWVNPTPNFWVTEPTYYLSSGNYYSERRFAVATGSHSSLGAYRLASVACVRDLVPTPSTPYPGKS